MAFVEIEDIQATREVVVFPRIYAASKELLASGNLVVVQGKVDAPEGRTPKVLADTIGNEITTYTAAGEMQPEAEPVEPPMPLFEIETALLDGVKEERNGYQLGSPETKTGNGHSNGSHLHPPAELALPPFQQTSAAASHRLHITLPRTGNLTKDKHRLKTVYNLLIETPGDDQFFLYIPNGNKKIQIEFPNKTTRYSARLEQQLVQILGAKSVRVD
jgi:hypothetical protein